MLPEVSCVFDRHAPSIPLRLIEPPPISTAAERTERAIEAERSVTDMRAKMTLLRGEMVADEKSTFDITAEMGRQYKAMQESMLGKITSLEHNILSLKDELGKIMLGLASALRRMWMRKVGPWQRRAPYLLMALSLREFPDCFFCLFAAMSRSRLAEVVREKDEELARKDGEIDLLHVRPCNSREDTAAEWHVRIHAYILAQESCALLPATAIKSTPLIVSCSF
jgi:hypothetical protein